MAQSPRDREHSGCPPPSGFRAAETPSWRNGPWPCNFLGRLIFANQPLGAHTDRPGDEQIHDRLLHLAPSTRQLISQVSISMPPAYGCLLPITMAMMPLSPKASSSRICRLTVRVVHHGEHALGITPDRQVD